MSKIQGNTFNPELDLKIERVVSLSPEKIWAAWTNPALLMPWFCPKPWKVVECEIDLVPGGIFRTVMQSPEGENFPNLGCYLELIANDKLVWTDVLLPGFRPKVVSTSQPGLAFTATIHLEKTDQGTRYTAIAQHSCKEDQQKHAEMGFEQGWNICLDQLVEHMTQD